MVLLEMVLVMVLFFSGLTDPLVCAMDGVVVAFSQICGLAWSCLALSHTGRVAAV